MGRSFVERKVKEAADGLNERHRQKLLTLASTHRHVIFSYPEDMTDEEVLDFAGWFLTGFRMGLPRADGIEVVHATLAEGD